MTEENSTVDISPSTGILSVLQNVNYTHWNALAEYIDNSLQSSHDNVEELNRIYGGSYLLEVRIDINEQKRQLTIADNAAGIAFKDFSRAFRTAKIPDNRKGLSEFGMGMKCASCWLGKQWQVKTKHLNDDVEREVNFDLDQIVDAEKTALPVLTRPHGGKPYTMVSINSLEKIPRGNTVRKIKRYLADIYRIFLREKQMILKFNGDVLQYQHPEILMAPLYPMTEGPEKEWKVNLDFELNEGQQVKGFAGILKKGSRSQSGFALFRRGRVIQGSGEDGYRPKEIFGSQSTFRYLRIFGELHLDGFEVSHTKDGFKWKPSEDEFIRKLQEELGKQASFLSQADTYRVSDIVKDDGKRLEEVIGEVVRSLQEEKIKSALEAVVSDEEAPPPSEYIQDLYSSHVFEFHNIKWKVNLQFNKNVPVGEWLRVSHKPLTEDEYRELDLDIALNHKIMTEHQAEGKESLRLLIKFAMSVGIASYVAKLLGFEGSDRFIYSFNKLSSRYIGNQVNE